MSATEINNNIAALFNPKTVAVIGASESPRKLGYHVMKSLTDGGFEGRIVPVNPGSTEIMGIPSSPSIDAFPDPIDLAIVVVPAQVVPKIFEECERKAIKGVVLITAGFKEIDDPSGDQQQMALAKIALKTGIRLHFRTQVRWPEITKFMREHSDRQGFSTQTASSLPWIWHRHWSFAPLQKTTGLLSSQLKQDRG